MSEGVVGVVFSVLGAGASVLKGALDSISAVVLCPWVVVAGVVVTVAGLVVVVGRVFGHSHDVHCVHCIGLRRGKQITPAADVNLLERRPTLGKKRHLQICFVRDPEVHFVVLRVLDYRERDVTFIPESASMKSVNQNSPYLYKTAILSSCMSRTSRIPHLPVAR